MYELFDHTADIGLRVVASDLDELFHDAARGFFSLVAEEIPDRQPVQSLQFDLAAPRLDHLLVDWLSDGSSGRQRAVPSVARGQGRDLPRPTGRADGRRLVGRGDS